MDKAILNNKIEKLEGLIQLLLEQRSNSQKISILESTPEHEAFFSVDKKMRDVYGNSDTSTQLVIASIAAIGEAEVVFRGYDPSLHEKFEKLIEDLWEVETFYHEMGGIVAYHASVLKLLEETLNPTPKNDDRERYLRPLGYELEKDPKLLNRYIRWGIENLPQMAELYPVGGAGDRLNLQDEETGEELPAAQLLFSGRPLLALLIRDVKAKEYLYYKLFGKQVMTPIAMMTSHEKNNHRHILEICERNHWFGRPEDLFFFFTQPLVPVITVEGHWSMKSEFEPTLKPGGHGVIWKIARDYGVFRWLSQRKRRKILLRQINNPMAGTDFGILAFTGIGCRNGKTFGFASCPRLLNIAEGMDILIERKSNQHYEYLISNVEYTNFAQKGIKDVPESPGSPYSQYPANTNILFADLRTIEDLVPSSPMPGMIINFKKTASYIDPEGNQHEVKAGRLESTMQNISDSIVERFPRPLKDEELLNLKTYLTYNDRKKTISVTKHSYEPSKPLLETPEGCFYEILQNNQELFKHRCSFIVPELCAEKEYVDKGPNLLIQFHPALGPLYSIIAQKIRKGKIAEGSELQLEIAELSIENLDLRGSLLITAENPLGKKDAEGTIHYSENSGKCMLKNVLVDNAGIDRSAENIYWKHKISRKEKLEICIKGNGEFFAENVLFKGNWMIEVPDGCRYTAIQIGDKIEIKKEEISCATWSWKYSFDLEDHIRLTIITG